MVGPGDDSDPVRIRRSRADRVVQRGGSAESRVRGPGPPGRAVGPLSESRLGRARTQDPPRCAMSHKCNYVELTMETARDSWPNPGVSAAASVVSPAARVENETGRPDTPPRLSLGLFRSFDSATAHENEIIQVR